MFVFGFIGPLEPMAGTTCSVYLPENIIFTIFSWLPVRSLLRLRSVCKLWLSIISNTLFIQTHLVNSHNKQAFVLKGREPTAAPPMKWMLYYVNPTREEFVRLNIPPECDIARVSYIHSCNGLVCLTYEDCKVIYILNPSTKRFKKIATPTIQPKFGIRLNFRLNFGFDCITNDYKLLRSACDVSSNSFKAELYSANADSWKEIQTYEMLKSFRIFPTSLMYMERFHKLVSHDEVLPLYPFPSYLHLRTWSSLLDFEGSFARIFSNGSVYSLWMLEDVCGKLSWNRKFNLEYFDSMILWVISYLGDGQFVAQDRDQYFLYDYKKKETKKFLAPASLKDITLVVKYTESLVSLNGFELWE